MSPSQPPFESGTLEANGVRLRYHRTGGNKPPLVLVHGMTDMGLCWGRVANGLVHKYDVVVYDARGHGDSDAPATGNDPESRAEDLCGLITTLGLDRPRLLGHSLGAMTVALVAAKYPALVRSAILEDPPFPDVLDGKPSDAQRKAWQKAWEEWRDSALPRRGQSQAELEAICRRQSPHWHELEIGPWAQAKLKISPHLFDGPNLKESHWWQCLPKIECPTLMLTADPGRGALMSQANESILRDFCPEVMLVRLQGAGHNIHRDSFERFMSLTSDFFARN